MINDVTSSTWSPNPVATTATPPGGALGKDAFLKMLVAQLRYQDPMNPMNGDDMAAQLAQFSSLEQLTNIGKALEGQTEMNANVIGSINDSAAMNIIGKSVLAGGDQVFVPADGAGSVRADVGGAGGLAKLKIYDADGDLVGSRDLGFVKAGRHEFELGGAVDGLPEGVYAFAIEVADAAGKAVPSQTYVSAAIDGVLYGPDGPVLTSGPLRIPYATILQIKS